MRATAATAAMLATILVGCDAFDAGLLDSVGSKPGLDAGTAVDAGLAEDASVPRGCSASVETCNGMDDDCDDAVDEDTLLECQAVILGADTGCFPFMDTARCLLVGCHPEFANCDGDPTNGCERPFCDCNECDDPGDETDGGTDDGGA